MSVDGDTGRTAGGTDVIGKRAVGEGARGQGLTLLHLLGLP